MLKTLASFDVIGVSAQPEKYGYEVFETLHGGGYTVWWARCAPCRCWRREAPLTKPGSHDIAEAIATTWRLPAG